MADSNILKEFFYKISFLTEGSGKSKKDTKDMDDKVKQLAKSVGKLLAKWLAWKKILSAITKYLKESIKYTITMNDTLEEQAKKLNKTTEKARAHLIALKVMGKTMDEINKNTALKKRYDELVALGEELKLPEGALAVKSLDTVRTAFDKLKLAAQYVFQWIYYYWNQYVSKPIKGLANEIDKFTDYIKKNIRPFSKKIGEVLAKLVRDAIQIIKDAIKVIDTCVTAIKGVLEALREISPILEYVAIAAAAAWAIMNFGPLTTIAIIIAVILLIDDLVTHLSGGESAFGKYWNAAIAGAMNFYNWFVLIYNHARKFINILISAANLIPGVDIGKLDEMNYYAYEDGEFVNKGSGATGLWDATKTNATTWWDSTSGMATDAYNYLTNGGSDPGDGSTNATLSNFVLSGLNTVLPYQTGTGTGTSMNNSNNTTTVNVNQNIYGTNAQAIGQTSAAAITSAVQQNLASGIS